MTKITKLPIPFKQGVKKFFHKDFIIVLLFIVLINIIPIYSSILTYIIINKVLVGYLYGWIINTAIIVIMLVYKVLDEMLD